MTNMYIAAYPLSESVQIVRQRLMGNELDNVTSKEKVLIEWLAVKLQSSTYVHSSHFNHGRPGASLTNNTTLS